MTTRYFGFKDDDVGNVSRDNIEVDRSKKQSHNQMTHSGHLSSLQSLEERHPSSKNVSHKKSTTEIGIPLSEGTTKMYGIDGKVTIIHPTSSMVTPISMVTPPTKNWRQENLNVNEEVSYISDLDKSNQPEDSSRPKCVPHVYHDYNRVIDDGGTSSRKKTGGVTQPFPEKLHIMLSSVDHDERERSIVSWLPHGRSFIVRNPTQFTVDIMPKYFKQTKLTSFQRQLNLYGFRRITQGPDSGAYYHEMFLKGRPGLCQQMTRQKVKGTGHKQPADVKTEPNFYTMSPVATSQRKDYYLGEPSSQNVARLATPAPYAQRSQPFVPLLRQSSTEQLGHYERRQPNRNSPSTDNIDDHTGVTPSTHVDRDGPAQIQNHRNDFPLSPGLQNAAHLLRGIASGAFHIPDRTPFLQDDEQKADHAMPKIGDDRLSQDNAPENSLSLLSSKNSSVAFLKPRLSSDTAFQTNEERKDDIT